MSYRVNKVLTMLKQQATAVASAGSSKQTQRPTPAIQ